jgi:drug/metabolite transporter (DMT)-like permease
MIGVTVIVGGALSDGHLFGDILGFSRALCMAIMMLIIRQHHETNVASGMPVGAALSAPGLAVRLADRYWHDRSAEAAAIRHHAIRSGPHIADDRR